jgi:hypothetical protein
MYVPRPASNSAGIYSAVTPDFTCGIEVVIYVSRVSSSFNTSTLLITPPSNFLVGVGTGWGLPAPAHGLCLLPLVPNHEKSEYRHWRVCPTRYCRIAVQSFCVVDRLYRFVIDATTIVALTSMLVLSGRAIRTPLGAGNGKQ